MNFYLQKESGTGTKENLEIDVNILKNELDKQRLIHHYEYKTLEAVKQDRKTKPDYIPVGSIDFVSAFLKNQYGIQNMNPIEIPPVLRQDRFLKRGYSIISKGELPKKGYYFIKYVSKLKIFSYTGLAELLWQNGEPLPDGLYQVSEAVDIVSEYRCFVHRDRLVAVNHYDGDCSVFPDMELVKAAIGNYQKEETRPQAYTMDVAVIKDRGTVLLEIHPWASVGLYGYLFGSQLPYCYRDGMDWYINQNTELVKYRNF